MIIVTGGAGMIGSNIIKSFNDNGYSDILVVDNLKNGEKFVNLVNLKIADYMDKIDFLDKINKNFDFGNVEAVFHQGACSSTTEWNGQYMMHNNYDYSKSVLHYCLDRRIKMLYASSAATYGLQNESFIESPEYEGALNVYGYSKQLFDNYVRKLLPEISSQVCGFRYFNVYGPNEQHKSSMASVAFHLNKQMNAGENPKLFLGSEGFKRDFIYVGDVCNVNMWFFENNKSGIYNCGTGKSESFEEIAKSVISWHGKGQIETIPFPEHLKGHYQEFTQADLKNLRNAGYLNEFKTVAQGVKLYLDLLNK